MGVKDAVDDGVFDADVDADAVTDEVPTTEVDEEGVGDPDGDGVAATAGRSQHVYTLPYPASFMQGLLVVES